MTSTKEQIWLNEYLTCWNATEAARRAGYRWPDKIGTRKLQKFADEIQQRVTEKAMGADEVLLRLAEQARCDYSDYITTEGTVDLERLKADGKMHLVKGIKETRAGKVIEFYDGQTALIHIGKHHGLFVDRREITGADGGPLMIKGYAVAAASPDAWPNPDTKGDEPTN